MEGWREGWRERERERERPQGGESLQAEAVLGENERQSEREMYKIYI
jgi:hypothetical protein